MASLQKIDAGTVHKICSGQVVLSLATAVKELVENSIDSGSTIIEVKLKNSGIETIEVSDNGCGISEENYAALALKHFTSKIACFDDVASVETYGFRGEALSSLCALANLSVVTRCKNSKSAVKLVYDQSGKLISTSNCPRQPGTTMVVSDLFSTLPVRYKEFHKNIKKELQKLLHVLTAYALISEGIRITCLGIGEKGKNNVMLKNSGGSVKENLSCIFGPKQLSTLLEIPDVSPSEECIEEFHIKKKLPSTDFKISGFVSTCAHGIGRACTDRQFIFVNRRPCDFKAVLRVVNEVFHQYNRNQYPFVLIEVSTEAANVDVNVTPDKRQLMVDNENILIAKIKTALIGLYEGIPSTFQIAPLKGIKNNSNGEKGTSAIVQNAIGRLSSFKRNAEAMDLQGSSLFGKDQSSVSFKQACVLTHSGARLVKQPKLDMFLRQSEVASTSETLHDSNKSLEVQNDPDSTSVEARLDESDAKISKDKNCDSKIKKCIIESGENDRINCALRIGETERVDSEGLLSNETSRQDENDGVWQINKNSSEPEQTTEVLKPHKNKELDFDSRKELTKIVPRRTGLSENESQVKVTFMELEETGSPVKRREKSLEISLEIIREKCEQRHEQRKVARSEKFYRNFRAKIDASDNQEAEDELKRRISREDFPKMELIGQFNTGFIVAKLRDDLFIVDQHATDEIYNFEDLQKNMILQSQRLVVPKQLELTCSDLSLLMDNLSVFERNGFQFDINHAAPSCERVKLTSLPFSRGTTFGPSDVEELLFLLSDCSNPQRLRPSKVRTMLASRACRKSVMIGKSLTRGDMRRLLNHMGEIELPWNCPHGRPTMRHLIDLRILEL